jgi:amidase
VLTAAEIAAEVNRGGTTAVEQARAALARLDRVEAELCAFHEVHREAALEQARRVDQRVRNGEKLPFAGVPIAVKRGERKSHRAKLLAMGCVQIGLTTTPDGTTAWQTWGRNARGPTRNPWRPDRSPGGSSAGSAVAVAAGVVPLATGADGFGSIRIPAAWCGVLGLKTTSAEPVAVGVFATHPDDLAIYLGTSDTTVPTAAWSCFTPAEPALVEIAWRAAQALRPIRADDPREWQADLLLTPTTPHPPHGHDGPGERINVSFTRPFNLSGHPAISIPAGFDSDGLPVGLQAVARHGREADLVTAARAVLTSGAACRLPRQAATARTDLSAPAQATSSSSMALSSSCCGSPSCNAPRPSAT